MIELFDFTLPCGWALLEYSEEKDIKDFDLTVPLTPGILSDYVATKFPHLLELCTKLGNAERFSNIIFDSFLTSDIEPSLTAFKQRELLLNGLNLEAKFLDDKQYFATVVYLGRDKEVRVVYRDPEEPDTKSNVHDKDGKFLYNEYLYQGHLPEELNWAKDLHSKLRENGIECQINHYKLNQGYPAKVYFRLHP